MNFNPIKFDLPRQLDSVLDLSKDSPAPLNHCMYCGSLDRLTDEHIFPFGFVTKGKGNISFKKSSCENCAIITSKFEREVMKGNFLGLRSILGFKSRKGSIPNELPLIIVRNGKEEEVSLPAAEHPIMLSFPIFEVPSELTGNHKKGVTFKSKFPIYNFGKPLCQVLKDLGAEDIKVRETFSTAFPRFIAKIAWGTAVACGFENRLNKDLCYSFMQNANQLGRWIGTYEESLEKTGGLLHGVRLREDQNIGYLVADIKLIADSQTPIYGVLLAKM